MFLFFFFRRDGADGIRASARRSEGRGIQGEKLGIIWGKKRDDTGEIDDDSDDGAVETSLFFKQRDQAERAKQDYKAQNRQHLTAGTIQFYQITHIFQFYIHMHPMELYMLCLNNCVTYILFCPVFLFIPYFNCFLFIPSDLFCFYLQSN